MLRFVVLSLVIAGLSNAAVFNQTHQDAKGVWNFQWNFGNRGALSPPDLQNPSHPLPACPTVQGCLMPSSCMAGPTGGHCETMMEPNTMCYSSINPPMNCERILSISTCACEADAFQQLPECPTVEGCTAMGECYTGSCNSFHSVQCYSSLMPPQNCRHNPTIQQCTCDKDTSMPSCPTVLGCAAAANCIGTPSMCNGAAEPNTQCYSMVTPPMNCLPDPAIPWCACDSGHYDSLPECPIIQGCSNWDECRWDWMQNKNQCDLSIRGGVTCYAEAAWQQHCKRTQPLMNCICDP